MGWLRTHSRVVWLLICLFGGLAAAAYGHAQDSTGSLLGRAVGGLLGGAGLGLIAWSRSTWLDVKVVAGGVAVLCFLSLLTVSASSGRGNLLLAVGVAVMLYFGITLSVKRGD